MTDTNAANNEMEESMEELEPITDPDTEATDDVVFDEDAELGDAEVVKKLRQSSRLL